jgi:hypothetical protein
MERTLSHGYGHRCDCGRLKLNRHEEMLNVCVKNLIITNCCGLNSLVKPNTKRASCSCVKNVLVTYKSI